MIANGFCPVCGGSGARPSITHKGFCECINCGRVRDEDFGVSPSMEEGRGMKFDFSKPQMSLLPLRDLAGVVRVLEFGAKKYARGDWKFVENGAFRYLDAGLRHTGELSDATTIKELRVLDHESGLPAIDHAICSLIFARHFIFKEDPKDGDK